jgi:hypothetical protein
MNSIILCEGSTDAILLSYYLMKVSGWEYCKKAPGNLDIKESEFEQSINWYKKDEDRLLICGVGGKDKMASFFKKKILSAIINANAFAKIAVVLDRDEKSIDSIESHVSSIFKPVITSMINNQWTTNTYVDTFNVQNSISCLLLTIPQEHQGALETLLLDSISEDPYDAAIVSKAGEFVKEMQESASRYIDSNRKKLKAHLGVTWAIQYPEKVFKLMNEQIISVPWEKSKVLHDCFRELEAI